MSNFGDRGSPAINRNINPQGALGPLLGRGPQVENHCIRGTELTLNARLGNENNLLIEQLLLGEHHCSNIICVSRCA